MKPKQKVLWTIVLVSIGAILGGGVYLADAQMGSPYIPEEKVKMMKLSTTALS